ncbi:MAG: hypothetical protein R2737_16440 [Candidatus Nanopelagicales bacterium]
MIGERLRSRLPHPRTESPDPFEATLRMWDDLRAGATTQAEREEIDAVFSRQVP